MEYKVSIHRNENLTEKTVPENTTVMDFLRRNSVDLHTPCGGNKKCGKCRVKISGIKNAPSAEEVDLLGKKAIKNGFRLACFTRIDADIDLYVDYDYMASILTEGKVKSVDIDPIIKKLYKAKEDTTRIIVEELETGGEKGNTTGNLYGIAIDVGTTTIAAYLYDLTNGTRIGVLSALNRQIEYGADVISRISFVSNSDENFNIIRLELMDSLNRIINDLCDIADITLEDIYETVLTGNTTMMHFVAGLNPKSLGVAPFVPVTCDLSVKTSAETSIKMNDAGRAVILPCISAYAGADTVSAILSTGMHASRENSLLVDIGTNGEIALSVSSKLCACSAAAGPAFEGANIKFGIGGVRGAIDSIWTDTGELKFTTIGSAAPKGICGSGIIDAVAVMLKEGVIDKTGRIANTEDANMIKNSDILDRLLKYEGQNAFRITDAAEDAEIVITQKDIREIQNAKAAICAAIEILINSSGINPDDIDNVYLAGGFGNYVNPQSAFEIGLLPAGLKGKTEFMGNAAGSGAIMSLLSQKCLSETKKIARDTEYIELSSSKDFMDRFVESMNF